MEEESYEDVLTVVEKPIGESVLWKLFQISVCGAAVFGITLSVILIYIAYSKTPPRQRTYRILACWCVNDILIQLRLILEILMQHDPNFKYQHTIVQTDACLAINSIVFMILLLSTTFGKTEKVSLWYVFGAIISLEIVTIITMSFVNFSRLGEGNLLVAFGLYLVLSMTLIVKECSRCSKKKSNMFSEDTRFRMNIVWIFLCNCGLIIILPVVFSFSAATIGFAKVSATLYASYIFAYLMYADKYYRDCFVKIFKRRSRKYTVNSSVCNKKERIVSGLI